ncbi:Stress-related protein [Drosera capensis]
MAAAAAAEGSRFRERNRKSDANDEPSLKYLDFVRGIAMYTIVWFSSLYVYAKGKCGLLKPSVEAVESMVKTVVGPVYDKYCGVPSKVLKFVDNKIVESLNKLNRHVPPVLRQVSTTVYSMAKKAPERAQTFASGVHRSGIVDVASGLAKNMYTRYKPSAEKLYTRYEPVALQYAVSAWGSLNRLPLFPQVAQVMVPTAAYCSEKYNKTLLSMADKEYNVASFLPLVPIEKIAKAFRATENGFQPLDAHRE